MWMRSVSGQTAQDFVSAYPTPRDNLLSCFPLNARFLKRFLILTVTVSAHGTVVQKYRVQIVQVAEMKCLPCGSTLVVLHPSPLHAEVELLRRWLCSESIFCPMFTRNRMRNGLWLQARGIASALTAYKPPICRLIDSLKHVRLVCRLNLGLRSAMIAASLLRCGNILVFSSQQHRQLSPEDAYLPGLTSASVRRPSVLLEFRGYWLWTDGCIFPHTTRAPERDPGVNLQNFQPSRVHVQRDKCQHQVSPALDVQPGMSVAWRW